MLRDGREGRGRPGGVPRDRVELGDELRQLPELLDVRGRGRPERAPFTLANCFKDLSYYERMATSAGAATLMSDGALQTLKLGLSMGMGERYITEMVDVVKRLNGDSDMKVIVLGAGVIGVTTAYYLAREGAEVRVLDRQAGPGMETSFANAGELSYGMTSPWAAPGIPQKAVKWLFMRHRPLFIWPLLSPRMWWWGVKMLANCNETAYRRNKGRMVRISNYSRDMMTELVASEPLEFDLRAAGDAAAVPDREAAEGLEGGPGGAGRVRLALRGARPRPVRRGRAGARARAGEVRRRPAADRGPHRGLPDVHHGARRAGGGDGGVVPLRHDDRAAR